MSSNRPNEAKRSAQYATGESAQSDSLIQSPDLRPGLHVVATPIGNLRDITLRALDTLAAADLILAEDTRQTGKLLSHFSIPTPMRSYHDHNAASSVPGLIARLQAGEILALVSDAGTPLVSDPGFRLVRACVEAGIEVWPLPGASAVLAGLVKAGLPSDSFFFAGFVPAKSTARRKALAEWVNIPATLVLYETGPRLSESLADAADILGDRPAVITRELTKTYEEARRGSLSDLSSQAKADPARGEIVVLIAPPQANEVWDEATLRTALEAAVKQQGVKRASAELAEMSGWAKRDVYKLALSLK